MHHHLRCEAWMTRRQRERPKDTARNHQQSKCEEGAATIGLYGNRDLVERIGPDAPLSAFPWLRMDGRQDDRSIQAWYEQHARGARIAMRYDSCRRGRRERP